MEPDRHLRRRELIAALGGLGVAAWPVSRAVAALTRSGAVEPVADAAVSCVLAPEQTEGPYWIPNRLTRRRITEGRPGAPLVLSLTVLNATTCRPIRGADVEVWRCDAGGVYSGVGSAASRRFLRGHQRADAAGRVRFDTIYPCWYRGRTTHMSATPPTSATASTARAAASPPCASRGTAATRAPWRWASASSSRSRAARTGGAA